MPSPAFLLGDEVKESAAVGGREDHFILQGGEIERGHIRQRHPICRAQIRVPLEGEIYE